MDSYVVDFNKLQNYIDNTYNNKNIILDGHVSHLLNVDYTIVLRCAPNILFDRLQKRNYSENKIYENIGAECLDVCLIEALDNCNLVYEIDTTNKTIGEILLELENAINNKLIKKGVVSWLEDYFYLMK